MFALPCLFLSAQIHLSEKSRQGFTKEFAELPRFCGRIL